MSYDHLEFDDLSALEPTMEAMETEDRLWVKMERTVREGHRKGKRGLYHVYKKI